jgi:mercuric reductase
MTEGNLHMSDDTFDLAVIGSGGAAMSAGITARQHGASVVLVERGTVGGTCVNIGCVPSKTLLAAAGTRHSALCNPFAGAPTSADGVDLGALVAQKGELTAQLRQAKYVNVADAYGFEFRHGDARFADADTLLVAGEPLHARSYVVATGAEPARPDLPGLDGIECLTSTTAMELDEVPESLVVIGGGYVGMEQAQLFAHLGATVTVAGRLAPDAEPELRDVIRQVFTDDGITVVEEHATSVDRHGDQIVVTTTSGATAHGARVLVATGRSPRTADLDLPAADARCDERGFLVVDDTQRSTNPRIYGAGDVTGAPQFVYVAATAGRVAALNALGVDEEPASVGYTGLPSVVFTRPQLASAGPTEAEALAAGHNCECRILGLHDVPRALANHDTRGAVKVVAHADTGKVLGVHAAADAAGEIMLAATYAIRSGMTVDDIADTWAPYLTMAESLRIAAGLFRNEMPTSCCA